ncbi:MAG: hypothetical protein QOJ93_1815 [Actinomycetota bacterium]|jgi:hypothetical protein|nr:hypothetical protein [Actinomycetota bacterium]
MIEEIKHERDLAETNGGHDHALASGPAGLQDSPGPSLTPAASSYTQGLKEL